MAIYRNVVVDVPKDAYVDKNGAVFVKDKNEYDPVKQYNRVKHTVIGRFIGEGKMYPNHNYRFRYPSLFEQASGEKAIPQTRRMGLYTAVLSLVEKNRLYKTLIKSLGVETANRILDYSLYLLQNRVDQAPVGDQLQFSQSGSLSPFEKEEIPEEGISRFRKLWAGICSKRGVREVWIAADNPRCLYAVDSKGQPVTFSPRSEEKPLIRQMLEMKGWLCAADMALKGVILEPEAADAKTLEALDGYEIPYVARLGEDTPAYRTLLEEYGKKIPLQYEYMLDRFDPKRELKILPLHGRALFGTESREKIRLLDGCDYRSYASLLFDPDQALAMFSSWYNRAAKAADRIQKNLQKKRKASIPKEYADFMKIEEVEGKETLKVDSDQLKNRMRHGGYFSLASSSYLTAKEMNDIYSLKSSLIPETSCEMLPAAFVCSVIKNALDQACARLEVSMEDLIQELNQICMVLNAKGEYFPVQSGSPLQKEFFKLWGIQREDLEKITEEENRWLSGVVTDPVRRFPVHEEPVKRGRGRPKGSPNRHGK